METILCAAIWLKDVERPTHRPINTPGGVVLCGYRHGHIIGQIVQLTGKKLHEFDNVQGFLTSRNRFLNREEAGKIHIENGGKLQYHKTDLFSEDLY